MQFVFTGFQQHENLRHYRFERIAEDKGRSVHVVLADPALLLKYQISLQDTPLLCLKLLEGVIEPPLPEQIVFSEEHMRTYAAERAIIREAALQAKAHRKFHKPIGRSQQA